MVLTPFLTGMANLGCANRSTTTQANRRKILIGNSRHAGYAIRAMSSHTLTNGDMNLDKNGE